MFYQTYLDRHQQLVVKNQNFQTIVIVSSSSPNQQQSQSSVFSTGEWSSPPQLYKTETGYIISLVSGDQEHFILVQGTSITVVSKPSLSPNMKLEWQGKFDEPASQGHTEFASMPSMQPMQPMQSMQPIQPMQPMQMGDMSMNLNDMSMQMGNMSLKMKPSRKKNFCTQCGQKVGLSDRFCASCGTKLS